jgi:hypothetical protein
MVIIIKLKKICKLIYFYNLITNCLGIINEIKKIVYFFILTLEYIYIDINFD